MSDTLEVGQHVVARDAFNELKAAAVRPVPKEWRDRSRSHTITTNGLFPKCWLWFPNTNSVMPWPLEDVFTDLAVAEEAVAAHRGEP